MKTTHETGLDREQLRLVKRVSRRSKRQSASLDIATTQLLRERLWQEAIADIATEAAGELLKMSFRARALERQENRQNDEWTTQEKMDLVTNYYGSFPEVVPCLPGQGQNPTELKQ